MNQPSNPEIQDPSIMPALSMPALRSQGEFLMVGVMPVSAQPEDSYCSICTEHLTEDVVQLAGACGHMFHTVCLLAWFHGTGRQNRTCPNCRCELYAAPASRLPDPAAPIRTVGSIMAERINNRVAGRLPGLLVSSRLGPATPVSLEGYDEEWDSRVAYDTPLVSDPTLYPPDVIARVGRAALRLGHRDRRAAEEISAFYGFPAFAQVLNEQRISGPESSSQRGISAQAVAERNDIDGAEEQNGVDYDLSWRTPGLRYH